jgi:predicted nucleotidyltransferase
MMNREQILERLRAERPDLRTRFGVSGISLFGSAARNDFGPASDVDVLVDFDRPITLFDIVAVQQHLEQCLGGRKVDVVPRDSLYPAFSPAIQREAVNVG